MSKYPLALSSWGEEEIQAIQNVVDSDMYSMGKHVQEFEEQFSRYLGAKYCVMVNSGSSANLLAVATLFYMEENPLKKGDEVIVPAVSWSTTYYPLHQYGLKLKFVDIDLETLNFNLSALQQAVSDQTKLILAVNLLGNPNQFDEIQEIIAGKNITLIEDNCESMGATFNGKQCGTFGVLGTFSTFFSHHMSTMEGGLVVTDDEELYHIMLSVRSHGWTRHLPKKNLVTGIKCDNTFKESFKFVLPGYNLRPIEMSGAIGIEQLKKLPGFVEQRRENAKYFFEKMSEFGDLIFQQEIGKSSWFGYSILTKPDSHITRDDLVSHLIQNDIDCRPIVSGNFVKNPVMKYIEYEVYGDLRNAEYIDEHGFFVGNHHIEMTEHIDYLAETVKTLFTKRF